MIRTLLSSVAAGAMIALAAYAALVAADVTGMGKLAAAAVFPAGLILVLMTSACLFTGQCLLLATDRRKAASVLPISWAGNLAGAVAVVAMLAPFPDVFATTAQAKIALSMPRAFILGIGCNLLVCLGVVLWRRYGAIGAYVPVALFVACGFEHSVADMFYLAAGLPAEKLLTALPFLAVVTAGNIVGGWIIGEWEWDWLILTSWKRWHGERQVARGPR